MELLRPAWLLLLPVGWGLLVYAWRRRHRLSAWRDAVDAELLPALLGRARAASPAPWWLAAAGWTLAVVALSGPAVETAVEGYYERVQARIVVLDLSPTMATPDVAPSRVERARFRIRDLLARDPDVQHALVAFSGDAFVVTPVTADTATVENLLDALSPSIMPVAGNRVAAGFARAVELFEGAGVSRGEVLLVSDGVDAPDDDVIEALADAGTRLAVLAVGTEAGAPIPRDDGGFVVDDDGSIVIAGVDAAGLEALADRAGGRFARLAVSDADLDHLYPPGEGAADARAGIREEAVVRTREIGPWLVLLLVPLAALGFRRGWVLLAVALVAPPDPAWAFGWDDLWRRADQRAAAAFDSGDYERAAALDDSPHGGAAHYRMGDFDGALENWASRDDADTWYNRGNALARAGRLEEALAAYDEALTRRPGMADTSHNRELVERLLADVTPPPDDGSEGSNAADPGQQTADSKAPPQDTGNSPGESPESASARDDIPSGAESNGNSTAANDNEDNSVDAQAESERSDDSGSGETPAQEADVAGTGDESDGDDQPQPMETTAGQTDDDRQRVEREQALEQWLRRVPDDPEGLLRRKFLYQYRQRQEAG